MKVFDTITTQEKFDMLSGQNVGIFNTMILPEDKFYNISNDMCIGYYTQHSGYKTVSHFYDKLYEMLDEFGDGYGDFSPNDANYLYTSNSYLFKVITRTPTLVTINDYIGSVIRSKCVDSWRRIYEALISEEYNILYNQEIKHKKIGNNTDKTTYNSQLTNDGRIGSKSTTINSYNSDDSIYGFNSNEPVNSDKTVNKEEETITALADDNTNHNVSAKSGYDDKNFTINETNDITGRNGEASQIIMNELQLRIKYKFFDIVYSDIDNILTTPLYF